METTLSCKANDTAIVIVAFASDRTKDANYHRCGSVIGYPDDDAIVKLSPVGAAGTWADLTDAYPLSVADTWWNLAAIPR